MARTLIFSLACLLLLLAGCAGTVAPPPYRPGEIRKELARLGYTIQAGAFSKVENASRLTEMLLGQGIDATYFIEKGLYKVRIGNFSTRAAALDRAAALKSSGIIDGFYIVSPGDYAVARKGYGSAALREELVRTARSFIGVPYLWGGADAGEGFDCSGLTMTVYRLNGLDLPRTSQAQAEAGFPAPRNLLSRGDLVFFQTKGGPKISHVGIYVGDNLFIHAPGRGRKICLDSLSGEYFQKRFAGGRSYM